MLPAKNAITTATTANKSSQTDQLKTTVKANIIAAAIIKTPSLGPKFRYGYIIIRRHFFHYLLYSTKTIHGITDEIKKPLREVVR